jgi:hypothetical protein
VGQSILVFVSHSSDDKTALIEPLVRDLEDCFINVWLDKRKIVPGDNLRKSIFREGLDKADVVLILFTEKSLQSSWVDREIKHVLRDEKQKGNNFDLNKIISIFDSDTTYMEIAERYPELTDDLLHLMPVGYNKIQLGQLVSAIWSKYLALQGGDVATQRQLLQRDREIFQKDQEISVLSQKYEALKSTKSAGSNTDEFERIAKSGSVAALIQRREQVLTNPFLEFDQVPDAANARAFGFIEIHPKNPSNVFVTDKGRDFFKWLVLSSHGESNS